MNIQEITKRLVMLSFIILLPNNSFSKDIYDVDLYGYKLSKSMFDYFTSKEIKGMTKEIEISTQNKFMRYESNNKTKDGLYDGFSFFVKKDDPDLILYGVAAQKFFGKNNIELCESKRKKITKELLNKYPKVKPNHWTYRYKSLNDGKSIAYATDFQLEGGLMRTYCVNWSAQDEEKEGYTDNLRIEVQSEVFLKYKK